MKSLQQNCRNLRKQQTDAENILWYYLRNRLMLKYKFRRQHVIGDYIVDFVCKQKKLIIELDGSQHHEQTSYDYLRTQFLNKLGYKVLRFWNNEVFENIDAVLEVILNNLQTSSLLLSRERG